MATVRGREFVICGDDGPVRQRIATALEPRFSVAALTRRAARQVWLDTFDGRLRTAGLVLRQVTGGRSGELVLSTAAGTQLACAPVPAVRWPRLIDAVPPGPVRDRLDPVVGIRALLPLARAEGTLTGLRVLDGEDKTVARITVDAAALTYPVSQALPPRLVISPVRGYQAAADQARRLLTTGGVSAPAAQPAAQAVLDAAGWLAPDVAAGPALSAAMPAPAALAGVLLRLAGTITANVGFVIRDTDTEFLHDLRVAVRRTRSVLKLAGDALPGDLAARFAPQFKWLGDLTTPVRDLDVYLTGFEAMTAGLRAASPGDLEPFRAQLAAQRLSERRRLVRALRSDRFGALMAGWRAALEEVAGQAAPREPGIGTLAADRIARAYRRVARAGQEAAGAGRDGPATELHELRKRGKELRYLLEIFGPLYEPAAYGRVVRDLRGLQDCLGEFQDADVQRDAIRGFAAQMLARPGGRRAAELAAAELAAAELAAAGLAVTLLAMGELTAQLDERQRRARAKVAGRFAEFTAAGSLRTLGIRTGTAKA